MEMVDIETRESIERNDRRIDEWFASRKNQQNSKNVGHINLNIVDYIKLAEALGIAPKSTKTK